MPYFSAPIPVLGKYDKENPTAKRKCLTLHTINLTRCAKTLKITKVFQKNTKNLQEDCMKIDIEIQAKMEVNIFFLNLWF